jgi:hypothetical protein
MVMPPIEMGQLWAIASQRVRPTRVLVIDGLFERMAAVWHKEILYAMERGIVVYGAASMGALRAAELAPFGMIGVGQIWRQFANGTLTADDEVAVAHLSRRYQYRAASEALVNIRATLVSATAANVISATSAAMIIERMANIHYRERTWDLLLEMVAALSRHQHQKLATWLPLHRIDQKYADAMIGLSRLRNPSPSVELAAQRRVRAMPRTWAMDVVNNLFGS